MTVAQANDAEIRRLIAAAEQARAAGRADEAARLLSQAQALSSEHPLVLNESAVGHLHRGDSQAARRLLESAVTKEEGNPSLWLNLATALRGLNLADDEMNALERVLALEPRHLLALLQKASLQERQGKSKAAARTYHNALLTIPRGTKLPEALRPAIQHAIETVRENYRALEAFLGEQLRDVREQLGSGSEERFDHCIASFLGKQRIYHPEPTFLHFPKLPAWEFYQRDLFPWLEELEAATAEIREEFERVFTEDTARLEPYIAYPKGVPLDQWAELNHSRRWSAFYLWRDGEPVPAHIERCPKTAAAMGRIPRVGIPGYAPTVFFSILDAKTHIPPHTGVTNTRLVVHLPLVIPPGCRFRVGSQTREWRSGTAWVFDDTIEHEAWNDSDVPRAIMIFDVWNPAMSKAERDLVRTAVKGIREYYGGEAALTGSI